MKGGKVTAPNFTGLVPISSIIGGNSIVAIEFSVRLFLGRHDHFADRPERYSSKFQMLPSERDADYGDGQYSRNERLKLGGASRRRSTRMGWKIEILTNYLR